MANKNAIPPDGGFRDHPERINKNGRPPKLPELDKLLADVLGEEKDGIEAAKAILMALRAKATKGDVRAAELILNRAYGKPKEHIDVKAEIKSIPLIEFIDEHSDKKKI